MLPAARGHHPRTSLPGLRLSGCCSYCRNRGGGHSGSWPDSCWTPTGTPGPGPVRGDPEALEVVVGGACVGQLAQCGRAREEQGRVGPSLSTHSLPQPPCLSAGQVPSVPERPSARPVCWVALRVSPSEDRLLSRWAPPPRPAKSEVRPCPSSTRLSCGAKLTANTGSHTCPQLPGGHSGVGQDCFIKQSEG